MPARLFLLLALLLPVLLAGCTTVPSTPAPERAGGEEDPLQSLEGDVIGFVVAVDPADGLAMIRMRSSSTRATPAMMARNDALVETAHLEPSRFRSGRTLGAHILSGLPNVGDEVIAVR